MRFTSEGKKAQAKLKWRNLFLNIATSKLQTSLNETNQEEIPHIYLLMLQDNIHP